MNQIYLGTIKDNKLHFVIKQGFAVRWIEGEDWQTNWHWFDDGVFIPHKLFSYHEPLSPLNYPLIPAADGKRFILVCVILDYELDDDERLHLAGVPAKDVIQSSVPDILEV